MLSGRSMGKVWEIPDLTVIRLLGFVGNSTCQTQIHILSLNNNYMKERVIEVMPLRKFPPTTSASSAPEMRQLSLTSSPLYFYFFHQSRTYNHLLSKSWFILIKMQFSSETISLMNMQISSWVNQQPMYTFCGWYSHLCVVGHITATYCAFVVKHLTQK